MSVYLDTSVLVALWSSDDAHSNRAEAFVRSGPMALVVSDFACAEFAAVLARHVRSDKLDAGIARKTFAEFDIWRTRSVEPLDTERSDIAAADAFLRRLDLNLRTPDAIHIGIAQRVGADLATFDKRMAVCAHELGVPLAAI